MLIQIFHKFHNQFRPAEVLNIAFSQIKSQLPYLPTQVSIGLLASSAIFPAGVNKLLNLGMFS